MDRRWLKQCRKCKNKYWGNAGDVGYCVSCAGTSMVVVECACGCGKTFEKKDSPNPKYVKRYFNRACQMRARRKTEVGKAYVEEYNKRYKREEKAWTCKFPLCGKVFMSTYKRTYCDEHSTDGNRIKVWRKKNPLKAKAHESVNSFYRDRYNKGRKREPCLVCGEAKTEAHHHSYEKSKARDVIHLCKPHHVELHSWDSN